MTPSKGIYQKRRYRKYTPELIAECMQAYLDGKSTIWIHENLDMPVSTTIKLLKARRIHVLNTRKVPPKHKVLDGVKDEVIRLYVEEKWTLRMIGEKFFVADSVVGSALRGAGVEMRSYSDYAPFMRRPPVTTPEQDVQMRRMYEEMLMSGDEIGRIFNISKTAVLRRLRAIGVETRRPGSFQRGKRLANWYETKKRYEKLYHEDKLTIKEIAELEGMSQGTLTSRMRSMGIEKRSSSEQMKLAYAKGRKKTPDSIQLANLNGVKARQREPQ